MTKKLLFLSLVSVILMNFHGHAQIADAEVIKYVTICDVTSGKLVESNLVTIQINNRAGDKYAEIELPYTKADKISDVDAWIEDNSGVKIRQIKKSDILDKSAISDISLYEDDFKKCFELKHNVYPYKITYTYKTTFKNYLTLATWSPIIHTDIPTQNATLTVILPKDFKFKKTENNLNSECRIDSSSSNLVLKWETSYLKQIRNEIFSQPREKMPLVMVLPLHFEYGVPGSTSDWKSYGQWQYDLNRNLDELSSLEKLSLKSLIGRTTDQKEIVRIIYHYIQDNTRYINVKIGVGGMRPYPASYVAANKYGDCKALTNYMKAALSAVGIESFYTVVHSGDQPERLMKNMAGPQFDHVVLAVPLKNDTIWLENTSNINPFGYMGTFTQNRDALLISKDNSRLVHIPALKKENVMVSNKLTFELNPSGTTRVLFNTSFRGLDFQRFNQLNNDYSAAEKDKIIRDYMPFENYEVEKWNLKKLNRDSARIDLTAIVNLSKFLKPLGNEYYLTLFPSKIPAFTIPENRVLPLELPYPICNSDSLIYTLPMGFELKTKFEAETINSPFGKYSISEKVVNDKILITKSMEIYSGSYTLQQYPDFYNFIQAVKNLDRKKILIKPINQ